MRVLGRCMLHVGVIFGSLFFHSEFLEKRGDDLENENQNPHIDTRKSSRVLVSSKIAIFDPAIE
jgi:hypothetical protein